MSTTKNAVRVFIGGEEYTVRSELSPEYTREVAAYRTEVERDRAGLGREGADIVDDAGQDGGAARVHVREARSDQQRRRPAPAACGCPGRAALGGFVARAKWRAGQRCSVRPCLRRCIRSHRVSDATPSVGVYLSRLLTGTTTRKCSPPLSWSSPSAPGISLDSAEIILNCAACTM